jgi:hypothetical protein
MALLVKWYSVFVAIALARVAGGAPALDGTPLHIDWRPTSFIDVPPGD